MAGYNLVMALPFAVLLYFQARAGPWKMIMMGAAGLVVLGILLTLSRAAYVSTAALWGLWMIRFRRIDQLRYALPVALIAVAVLVFAPGFFEERVSSFASAEARAEDRSIQKRVRVNYDGLRAFAASPAVGQGVLGFGTWANAHSANPEDYKLGTTIHNSYLQAAAELGLLGVIPYLMVLALTWRDLSRVWLAGRSRGADPEMAQLAFQATFLQMAFLAGLIGNFFQPTLLYKSQWLLIGLASAIYWMARTRSVELGAERKGEALQQPPVFGSRSATNGTPSPAR